MKREELIKQCRYYKGDRINPFSSDRNKNTLWFYERAWLNEMLSSFDFSDMINDMSRVGLGEFAASFDMPVTLVALLFNRYAKDSNSMAETAQSFREFLPKYYPAI